MNRRGFSLIELTVVLLILSITAGAVAMRVSGPMRNAQMREVLSQVEQFDLLTRRYARNHDRALHLVVDPAAGELRREDANGREDLGRPLSLPRGFRIGQLVLAEETFEGGTVAISCNRLGLTRTYALRIDGPNGRVRWLLFTGLTGQVTETNNAQKLETIFPPL
jgi:prepilin-type N-terminal cleavage/methylation domain-containing protein